MARAQRAYKRQGPKESRRITAMCGRICENLNPSSTKDNDSMRPLFSFGEQALLRVSHKIDNLSDAIQSSTRQQTISNNHSRPSSSSPARKSDTKSGGNFQQHLFNTIFKRKLIEAFTEPLVYAQPFEYFVTNFPMEVHRFLSKISIMSNMIV